MNTAIHWIDWAGQPDLKIACGGWTTPLWSDPEPPPEGCHWAEPRVNTDEPNIIYTLHDDADVVTCPACLTLLRANLAEEE